jgi:hypothetical protein
LSKRGPRPSSGPRSQQGNTATISVERREICSDSQKIRRTQKWLSSHGNMSLPHSSHPLLALPAETSPPVNSLSAGCSLSSCFPRFRIPRQTSASQTKLNQIGGAVLVNAGNVRHIARDSQWLALIGLVLTHGLATETARHVKSVHLRSSVAANSRRAKH